MTAPGRVGAQGALAPRAATGVEFATIAESDVRTWLTALSSDVMQGRGAFTEGYGLAAAYVAEQLAGIGATPLGIEGGYLQPVTRYAYRVTRNSTITVDADGKTQTFVHGENVSFPALSGSPQTLRFSGVDFVGYGLPTTTDTAPLPGNRLVVLLPGTPNGQGGRRSTYASMAERAGALIERGAAAAIVMSAVPAPQAAGTGGRRATPTVDLTTVERVDRHRPPVVTGNETFFEFLMAGAPQPFAELRTRAQRGQPLEPFTLADVSVTIAIDHTYEVVTAERTHNVVAMVPGSDPQLRDTYVLFGAHLDHVGAASGERAPGRANVPVAEDPIWNGADDDGSGSSAVLAIAKAMMNGPRPKRSTVFVWHTAEEDGLLGSQAMADEPVVPLASIQAVFNIDMIGRNRDNDPAQGDTVYLIGADRISTDLHNVIEQANQRPLRPLTLDYHYNDPADVESFYTRSDHYSYASKGIPVAFFFTGTHPDYHANTDTVDKILFPKLVRITQLIYEAGFGVADSAAPLRRDNLGPRAGRGFKGLIPAP
jgi:hypothetical protein